MNTFFKTSLLSLVLATGLATATPGFAYAPRSADVSVMHVAVVQPFAVSGFCAQNGSACRGGGSRSVTATPDLMALLKRVNGQVNRSIAYRPERFDDWQINPRSGDCEDYALTKRAALLRAGLPGNALRIATTKTRRGEPHAILIVQTSSGNFVLDNRSGSVRELGATEYHIESISRGSLTSWSAG